MIRLNKQPLEAQVNCWHLQRRRRFDKSQKSKRQSQASVERWKQRREALATLEMLYWNISGGPLNSAHEPIYANRKRFPNHLSHGACAELTEMTASLTSWRQNAKTRQVSRQKNYKNLLRILGMAFFSGWGWTAFGSQGQRKHREDVAWQMLQESEEFSFRFKLVGKTTMSGTSITVDRLVCVSLQPNSFFGIIFKLWPHWASFRFQIMVDSHYENRRQRKWLNDISWSWFDFIVMW